VDEGNVGLKLVDGGKVMRACAVVGKAAHNCHFLYAFFPQNFLFGNFFLQVLHNFTKADSETNKKHD
jgi:hypothetical protein